MSRAQLPLNACVSNLISPYFIVTAHSTPAARLLTSGLKQRARSCLQPCAKVGYSCGADIGYFSREKGMKIKGTTNETAHLTAKNCG